MKFEVQQFPKTVPKIIDCVRFLLLLLLLLFTIITKSNTVKISSYWEIEPREKLHFSPLQ